jgi:ParB family chromosome partitioning protein
VYAPILRKVDALLDEKLSRATEERARRARVLLAFDDAVAGAVARLKEKGFDSPYLKNFVVARVNPLRFMKGSAPPFDELLAQMTRRAAGMDPGKVKSEDLAAAGGGPGGEE